MYKEIRLLRLIDRWSKTPCFCLFSEVNDGEGKGVLNGR